jgi:Domain of unknown function (DUF5666)
MKPVPPSPWAPQTPPVAGRWLGRLAAAILCAALAACGGGDGTGDDASDGSTSAPLAKEFKGTITEVTGPTSFTVEGIAVDASSANIPSNLVVGAQVKVDGVMTNGVIAATKVEFEGVSPSADNSRRPNRIEGTVTAFNSLADFSVNGIPVNASGAERVRGTVAVGAEVDVRGIVVDGVLIANRVKVESRGGNRKGRDDDDDDDDRDDDNGVVDELEGTITAFTSNTSFTVGSTPVNASGVASIPAGLQVGVRVEMDGRLADGVFAATTLKIDD